MKFFLLTLILLTNSFSYENEFQDLLNKYIYNEGKNKLILVIKNGNIRDCNNIECNIIRKTSIGEIYLAF